MYFSDRQILQFMENKDNYYMIELLFSVRAKVAPGQRVRVVGSTAELGNWNPQYSLSLSQQKQAWEGTLHNVNPDIRLEFKLIKIKATGQIQWQQLPNNSNRKFKPKFSIQLHLEWNEPAGRVNSLINDSFKLNGLPAVMLNKPRQLKPIKGKVSEQFDPYSKARDDESEEENQEEFLLTRRRMSEQININNKDMEETYNKNSSVQILAGLMKKIKIYVVSKDLEAPSALHLVLEEELNHLPPNYFARWITQDSISQTQTASFSKNLKRTGSLFEIGPEELYLQSLYSLTSYFMILDLEVAFALNNVFSRVSCCLYLPSKTYEEVINNLPKLTDIDLICFDSMEANKAFYQYLKSKDVGLGHEEGEMEILSMEIPSIQSIVHELQKLKYRETEIVNTVQSLTISQLKDVISKPNTVCVMDSSIFEDKEISPDVVIQLKDKKTMILIICEEELSQKFLQKMQDKSNVFVYQNFQKIRLEGKEFYPLRSFRQTLEQLKMISRLYKDKYGGEIVERESSFLYFLPADKTDMAIKIELQAKKVIQKFAFAKVSRKGIRIKISWNLSKEARLIRTLSELKYVNMGELGDFNLIAKKMNFKGLRDDIKILIELLPQLFINGNETKVNDYEYGCYSFQKIELKKFKSEMDK